ncbi:MAG TPA: transporter [Gammaproteobacteria bacterium]|nr:transporter [Gammaproteobacteria bacterium]
MCRVPLFDVLLHGAALLLAAMLSFPVHAGPPFLTDDPEPVPLHHHEFYVFSTLDRDDSSTSVAGPAIEYNDGIAPETQFHVVLPFARFSPHAGGSAFGFGDMELGIKYRFVKETSNRPQIGIFPMIEVPTGSAARGLGNGQAWYRVPLWVQKSWGSWTSYGGAGYTINHASGMHNAWFGGWLLQHDVSDKLTLGGEVFRQGPDAYGSRGYSLVNLGGYYNFKPDFSLLFSAGHTFTGDSHQVAYLGLYWTWGADL